MTAGCLVARSAKKTPDGITVEGDTIKVGVFEPVTGENGRRRIPGGPRYPLREQAGSVRHYRRQGI